MKNKVLSTMLLGAASVPVITGEAAEFIPLGDLPGGDIYSNVLDLSADGSTVLGQSASDTGVQLFRWSAETGFFLVPLYDQGEGSFPNFFATSISGDGSVVGGYAFTGLQTEAVTWSAIDGFSLLGTLPAQGGSDQYSLGVDISADGSALAASGTTPTTPFNSALRWTSSMGLVDIGFLPEDQPDEFSMSYSFAQAISSDGDTVVGSSASTKHMDRGDQAFRWTMGTGMQPLGFLPGETSSTATAVSADGSVVVGLSGETAFRWTEESGMEAIGSFYPTGVSADGSVVVGSTMDFDAVAMIWTPATLALPLQTYLATVTEVTVPGWISLNDAAGVSTDGSVIAGTGVNGAGFVEGFLVTLGSAMQSSEGAISWSGPVKLFVVDPDGNRYGRNPEDRQFYNEIPGIELSEEGAGKTATWPEIASGEHLVYVAGKKAGEYALDFSFLHLDSNTSSASFTGELLKGGLHVYAAEISADTAGTAEYHLIHADTDGDGVVDSSDVVPKSDLRPKVFIGKVQTRVPNRVLSNGASLNDVVKAKLEKAKSKGDFVSAITKLSNEWVKAGFLPKDARKALQDCAKQACHR